MTTDRKQTKYRNRRREPQDTHETPLTGGLYIIIFDVIYLHVI